MGHNGGTDLVTEALAYSKRISGKQGNERDRARSVLRKNPTMPTIKVAELAQVSNSTAATVRRELIAEHGDKYAAVKWKPPPSTERERVTALIFAHPKVPSVEIAKLAGVSYSTVNAVRNTLIAEHGNKYAPINKTARARRMMEHMLLDFHANANAVRDVDPLEVDAKEVRADLDEIIQCWCAISEFIDKVRTQL